MHVEMFGKIHVTSIWGLYHSLKDSPCCTEWIDACYKWLFENMWWVQTRFICMAAIALKILEKADFNKRA